MQIDLSERELEIVKLLHKGLSNQEIADKTGLTLYTIKWYLKQIYSKLHVSNRTQAVTRARELGFLQANNEDKKRLTSYLPQVLAPFFGRESELRHLQALLISETIRLITVHGIGGMGKTRLALEVPSVLPDAFSDGVFFVSLAQFEDNPLQAIAETMRLTNANIIMPVDDLVAYLRDMDMLIILDNFEHLLHYAPQVAYLLQHTRKLRVLVTSRELLRIQGEVVFALEGLQIPLEVEQVQTCAGYQLYMQRAQAVYADFALRDGDETAIHALCQVVDGMPLALELAAGWASVMSVQETYQRLQANLDLLATIEQDRPERQRSIRVTIDYSWQLLEQPTQNVLLRLGVFHPDGFSLQAAEEIAGATLQDIQQLLSASLLQHSHRQGRFAFHPLIRQYIREKLTADEALWKQIQHRHGEYYLQFVVDQIEFIRRKMDIHIAKRFNEEIYNLYKAWYYALTHGHYDWLMAAVEVGYLCDMVALWRETDNLFSMTQDNIPPENTHLNGRLLAFRALFAYRLNHLDTMMEFAHKSWSYLQDSFYVGDAVTAMSFVGVHLGIHQSAEEGLTLLERMTEALQKEDIHPNPTAHTLTKYAKAVVFLRHKRYDEALPLLEDEHNIPPWHETRIHLPECHLALGRTQEARQRFLKLYALGLDYRNYRLTMACSFYLTLMDTSDDDLLKPLIRSFSEICHIIDNYALGAQLIHFFAGYLILMGEPRWAKWVVCANLHVLGQLDAPQTMYRYAFETFKLLQQTDPTSAQQFADVLMHDTSCPPNIRQNTKDALQNADDYHMPRQISTTPKKTFLEAVDDILLK
jgi:DNA-binding CsgD family transcriptional regulator